VGRLHGGWRGWLSGDGQRRAGPDAVGVSPPGFDRDPRLRRGPKISRSRHPSWSSSRRPRPPCRLGQATPCAVRTSIRRKLTAICSAPRSCACPAHLLDPRSILSVDPVQNQPVRSQRHHGSTCARHSAGRRPVRSGGAGAACAGESSVHPKLSTADQVSSGRADRRDGGIGRKGLHRRGGALVGCQSRSVPGADDNLQGGSPPLQAA
jgi:hypothetical protein